MIETPARNRPGVTILLDDEDADFAGRCKVNPRGYVFVGIKNRKQRVASLILSRKRGWIEHKPGEQYRGYRRLPPRMVNGIKTDLRRANIVQAGRVPKPRRLRPASIAKRARDARSAELRRKIRERQRLGIANWRVRL